MQPVLFLPDGIVHRLGKYAYEIRYEARQKARKKKGSGDSSGVLRITTKKSTSGGICLVSYRMTNRLGKYLKNSKCSTKERTTNLGSNDIRRETGPPARSFYSESVSFQMKKNLSWFKPGKAFFTTEPG